MMVKEILSDILILAGCAAIVYGAWLIHPIAAYLVGGVLMIAGGYVLGLEIRK